MRHLSHDEGRVDPVRFSEGYRGHAIVGPEHHSHHEEHGKLKQNGPAARDERQRSLFLPPCRQQPLDKKLIRAVAGGSKCRPANHSSPKCVRDPEARGEIEDSQFARARGSGMNGGPTSGHKMQDRPQPDQCSADVDHGLHHVGPDHSCEAAFERIDERQYSNDGNRRYLSRAQSDSYHNRYGIDAHSLGGGPSQEE